MNPGDRSPPPRTSPDEVLARARRAFRAAFGAEPSHAAAAPGRVNLIGEHTDYNDGFVLPIAIDRWCAAAAGPAGAEERGSAVFAGDLGEWCRFDAAGPVPLSPPGGGGVVRGTWGSYVAGVAEELRRAGLLGGNFRLAFTSTVPFGGGLSSSASLEVSVASALLAMGGRAVAPPDPLELARLCQRAEHGYAGVPCGIMDQLASVRGREGHALLIDCRSLGVRPVPMPPPKRAVVLVMDSKVRHALAGGEYASRRAACERAARALGVGSLRDARPPDSDGGGVRGQARAGGFSDEERRCVRHVVSENARTLAAAAALERGDLPAFGRLMIESHASLRDDYRVSCAELDTLVDAALACPGVYGARMTGGGFGGCAVALVERAGVEAAAGRIGGEYRAAHGRDAACFVVRAVDGVRPG